MVELRQVHSCPKDEEGNGYEVAGSGKVQAEPVQIDLAKVGEGDGLV